jgi:hypothetical protein
MLWARLLAYVTGTVNQELLLRNEYLAAENGILRGQIKGRLLLSEGEKATLAEIAHRLGRMVLEDVAAAICSVGPQAGICGRQLTATEDSRRSEKPRLGSRTHRR